MKLAQPRIVRLRMCLKRLSYLLGGYLGGSGAARAYVARTAFIADSLWAEVLRDLCIWGAIYDPACNASDDSGGDEGTDAGSQVPLGRIRISGPLQQRPGDSFTPLAPAHRWWNHIALARLGAWVISYDHWPCPPAGPLERDRALGVFARDG